MDIRSAQKLVWENKVAKGFNTTDVPLEFCLLQGELAEAFDTWRKGREDLGEETRHPRIPSTERRPRQDSDRGGQSVSTQPADETLGAAAAVADFHHAFNLPMRQSPSADVDKSLAKLRVALLQEEVGEFITASEKGDLVAIADALADITYVVYGTALATAWPDGLCARCTGRT